MTTEDKNSPLQACSFMAEWRFQNILVCSGIAPNGKVAQNIRIPLNWDNGQGVHLNWTNNVRWQIRNQCYRRMVKEVLDD